MVDPIAFNHLSLLIREQWKGDVVRFGISTHLAGPLTNDAKNRSAQVCVFVASVLEVS